MAPEPHGTTQEENGGGSPNSIIEGHRISLSVHYNDEIPSGKMGGQVTPIEELVASTGALTLETSNPHASRIPPSVLDTPPSLPGEKVTRIDQIIRENGNVEPESLNSSLPSSPSSLESSCSEGATPETASPCNSAQGTPQSVLVSKDTRDVKDLQNIREIKDMFKSPIKQTEYLNGPDQIITVERLRTWEPAGAVKLKVGEQGISSYSPVSIPTFIKRVAEQYPDVPAMAVKKEGAWVYTSYRQYYDQIRTMAKAFIKLGLQQYHGVCILGFNSPEWFISDLAAIFAGGFAAGIYTTNSAEACEHCALNCQAQIWIVEDQKQLDKVLKIKSRLPYLHTIIQYSGKPTTEGVLSWEEAMAIGREVAENELEGRLRRIAINQCSTLIYTSGTTGPPKGVMLSHDNITFTANSVCIFGNFSQMCEKIVSFLPLSHVAAQMADMYVCSNVGGTVYFASPDALRGSLINTLKEVCPTRFLGVPRVWEKIHEKMMEVGHKTTGVKRTIASWAKAVGLAAQERKQNQDFTKPWGYTVANAIVFKKIRGVLGLDNCDLFLSGAAPIGQDIVKYFHSLDIPLTEIYGMSESTGPHTMGIEKSFKLGSVGKTLGGLYTKLDKPDQDGQGEVFMGGRNICMGYLHEEVKTNEAIDEEGWLHSGDLGKLDKDGFLFITGRLKELIITAGGENIAPVVIEDFIKAELDCISNAMLIGDKRKFLSILLTLKTNVNAESGEPNDTLSPSCIEWCRNVGSNANSIQDILSGPDINVMKAIQEGIDRANKAAPSNAQKVQKWTILPKDFSTCGNELGPTMKLKRPVVVQKYSETIERFYQ